MTTPAKLIPPVSPRHPVIDNSANSSSSSASSSPPTACGTLVAKTHKTALGLNLAPQVTATTPKSAKTVYLHPDTYAELFAQKEKDRTPRFLQINNFIYLAKRSKQMAPGALGMTLQQKTDTLPFTFKEDGTQKLKAAPLHESDLSSFPKATALGLDLSAKSGQKPLKAVPLQMDELSLEIQGLLKNCVTGRNEPIELNTSQGVFFARVKEVQTKDPAFNLSSFFQIVPETAIVPQIEQNCGIRLKKPHPSGEGSVFQFTLKLDKPITRSFDRPYPLSVNFDELCQKIKERQQISSGEEFTLECDGLPLRVKLDAVENEECSHFLEEPNTAYVYTLKPGHNFNFEIPSADVLFTQGERREAEEFHFAIESCGHPNQPKDAFFSLNAGEVEALLREKWGTLSTSQTVLLKLFDGTKVIARLEKTVTNTASPSKNPHIPVKNVWQLQSGGQISLRSKDPTKFALHNGREEAHLKSVKIEILGNGTVFDTKGLFEEELITAIQKKLQGKGVMRGSSFKIFVKGVGKIPCNVLGCEFTENPSLAKTSSSSESPYKSLGAIGPTTAFEFENRISDLYLLSTPSNPEDFDPLEFMQKEGFGITDPTISDLISGLYDEWVGMSEFFESSGIDKTRGILLEGPPGTGKTTFAELLAKALGCSKERLLCLSAPELLNKYLGGTEKKIRELFAPAEAAFAQLGKNSPPHVIILDEIDALFKARGSGQHEAKESALSQLLSKLDGTSRPENVIIIGTTNNPDSLDEALVRDGRLSKRITIGLPDAAGRRKIFEIHTRKLREINAFFTEADAPPEMSQKKKKLSIVIIDELIALTEGFTGAEIKTCVSNARASSAARLKKQKVPKERHLVDVHGKVTQSDFLAAIQIIERKKMQTATPASSKDTQSSIYN